MNLICQTIIAIYRYIKGIYDYKNGFMKCYIYSLVIPVLVPIILSDLIVIAMASLILDHRLDEETKTKPDCSTFKGLTLLILCLGFVSLACKSILIMKNRLQVKLI